MKYHTSTSQYHCGIDLHARQMYVCVMDSQGNKLLHMNIKNNDFEFFLKKIAPWRHDMTVCCECLFCWYWLADACEQAGLKFVLAHALYLKAIHGGKNKNDRIDSESSRGSEARWTAAQPGRSPEPASGAGESKTHPSAAQQSHPHRLRLSRRQASRPRPAAPAHLLRLAARRVAPAHQHRPARAQPDARFQVQQQP